MPRLALAAALAALAAGCARSDAVRVAEPIAPARDWVSPLHRDHPLVGRIWDVARARFVEEPALDQALAGAPFVLLGEVHDNPDHHLLQARLLRSLLSSGRRPAVAFEMLSVEQQSTIDAARAEPGLTAQRLGQALGWDQSGWPPFRLYQPIFETALGAQLVVLGANLPRARIREVVKEGEKALPPGVRDRIARQGPLSPQARAALRKEMADSHCGELPDALLDPMILGQRARDAQMAEVLLRAGPQGAVLVAGAEHARTDRGAPAYLAPDAGDRRAVAVAFREVDPGELEPLAYARDEESGGVLPWDYVIFTPAAQRPDPCEGLREHHRAQQAAQPAPPPAAPASPPPTPPATP